MKIIITENQYKILLESNTESMQNVIDIAFKSLKENVEDGFFEVSYVEDSVYVTEEIKVVEVANKNVKKFPSESLKNYKSGDIVVSKNDGNKYKVVMYKNQKKWKLIEE